MTIEQDRILAVEQALLGIKRAGDGLVVLPGLVKIGSLLEVNGKARADDPVDNTDLVTLGYFNAHAAGGTLADHDHSGKAAGDGGMFDAANLTSGAATDGYVLTADGAGGAAWESASALTAYARTDPIWYLDGWLATTTDVGMKYVAPYAGTISKVYIVCKTTGSAGNTIVDVNLNGTTIFTTQANRPTLAYNDADGAAVSGTPDVTGVTAGDLLTVDIDGVATGAKDLTVIVAFIQALAPDKLPREAVFLVKSTLATEAGALRIYNQTGATITLEKVFLAVGTAPTGAAILVDIHLDGTTIFSTQANRPQVAAGANTGQSTALDVTAWLTGHYITCDIDQVGSTIAGADLSVHVIGR